MEGVPYLVMAAVHVAVLAGFLVAWRRGGSPFTLLAAAVAAGLAYDNVMIGIGEQLGEGDALLALSRPRFWVHGLFTPLLMVIALSWVRDLGSDWARTRVAWVGIGSLTGAVALYGLWHDVLHLDIEITDDHGVLRYTYVDPATSLPGPVITVVVLVGLGVVAFRAARWPWLLAGSAFMFVASGGGAGTPYVANVGETVLALSLLATARAALVAVEQRASGAPPEPAGQTAG